MQLFLALKDPNVESCCLLTLIVLFYTFDVVKLGRGKQFTSKQVEKLADSGGRCGQQPRENERA